MPSAFSAIEMGKRSLQAHNQGISTIGHNISNVATEGYSRQQISLKAFDPLYEPQLNREERPGMMGTGVEVASVTRVRDMLLEDKIVSGGHREGYWKTRDNYLLMLEKVYNEPADTSVRSRLDKFWEGWQELSQNPEQTATRNSVVQRGAALMDSIHARFEDLSTLGRMVNDDVAVTVGEINSYLRNISALNVQIEKVKAMKDNPNDLYDRRDLLVNKLSELIPITTEGSDPDEFQIHTNGGTHLIQGKIVNPLELQGNPENEGYWDIVRQDTGETYPIAGGKLGALLEMRDTEVRTEIQKLDTMTVNFVDLVNEIHREGYGQDGVNGRDFFVELPYVLGVDGSYDRNGDGALDSSLIFRVSGQNRLNPDEKVGLAGTLRVPGPEGDLEIAYFPTDTVKDIISRINNSGAEISAALNREGVLTIKGTTASNRQNQDFVIRGLEDSGQFLVGYSGILAQSGPAGAFSWNDPQAVSTLAGGLEGASFAVAPLKHPSAWIDISGALTADPTKIAAGLGSAGQPADLGDGSAAQAIASLRTSAVMIGRSRTFDDYFADTVADIGLKGETSAITLKTVETDRKELKDLRDSISGVNLDEEFANLIKFQHGFNATAKFISEVNAMLDTIINRMGA